MWLEIHANKAARYGIAKNNAGGLSFITALIGQNVNSKYAKMYPLDRW